MLNYTPLTYVFDENTEGYEKFIIHHSSLIIKKDLYVFK
jgi:hypothetical protein